MPNAPHQGLSFDEALTRYIGQFGKFQIRVFFLASLLWLPNSLFILLMVFANKDPIKAHWWECVDSNNAECNRILQLENPGPEFCSLPRTDWEWTDIKKSIVSQFDLICGKSWLAQLVNSAFFLGYLIGSGIFGSMSDQRGRKNTLFGAAAFATLSTIISSFAPNYWVYFVSRIFTGIGAAGQALVTYILATESVGPAWRGAVGVGTNIFFIVGEFLLVLVAYVFQPWRGLCLATVVISALSLLLYPLLPESPRWLLVKGRKDEAMAIMEKMAAANGTRMPTEPLAGPPPGSAGGSSQETSLIGMLKDRHICRRFIVLSYAWLVLCMTYYGISLALNGLKGSIYVTFMAAAAVEIPSNLLAAWLIEKIGRHNSLAAGMLLAGISCLACSFCPPGAGQAVLATIGKFGCAGAFTIASIFTSELFPTSVRSSVLGVENEAARIGGIAAPFIVLVGIQMNSSAMPFLIFGATSVVAGLAIFTLPETLGAPMPDSMKDMDAIQSIFTTGAWKKGLRATTLGLFQTRATPSQSMQNIPEEAGLLAHAANGHCKDHPHGDGHGHGHSRSHSHSGVDASHAKHESTTSEGHALLGSHTALSDHADGHGHHTHQPSRLGQRDESPSHHLALDVNSSNVANNKK